MINWHRGESAFRMRPQLRTYIHSSFALLALLLSLSGIAFSDSLTISGLQFDIDSIAQVDANSSKVSVLGETRIVSKAELDEFVAGKVFTLQPNKFDSSAVENFTLESLSNGRARLAQIGLKQLFLLNPKSSDSGFVSKFMEQLGAVSVSKAALSEIRESLPAGPVTSRIVLELAKQDPEWVRSTLTKFTFVAANDLKDLAEDDFRAALQSDKIESARQITNLVEKLFGPQDSLYQRLSICMNRLQGWLKPVRFEDLERLYPSLQATWRDKDVGDLLSPYFVGVLNREAAKLIDSGKAQSAIQVLSHIDFTRRTEKTHELVLKALNKISRDDGSLLEDDTVRRFLELLSLKDDRIREAYLGYLDWAATLGASRSDPGFIEVVLNQAIALRSDPNRQNDSIRLLQAKLYTDLGMPAAAQRTITDVQTIIGPIQRIELFMSGYYVDLINLMCFLAIFVIGGLLYLRRNQTSPTTKVNNNISGAATRSINEAGEEVRRQFVGMTARLKDQHRQEYNKCLAKFGLEPDASEKMIKSAYRNAVKEVHPDMAGDDNAHNPDQFIKLTEIYERALELRKELGFVD
jgi:uncharacterized membrane protein